MQHVSTASSSIESGREHRAFWRLPFVARAEVLALIAAQALVHRAAQRHSTDELVQRSAQLAAHLRRILAGRRPANDMVERSSIASRLNPFPKECVAESVVLWTWLRAHDHPAELWAGCRTITGRFEAHAWVELHGAVLYDPDHDAGTWTKFDRPLARGTT